MQLRAFYSLLLPPVGQFVLFQNFNHLFFDTLDELVAATEARLDTQGLYFATAAFNGEANRKQSNVRVLRAHRIDIDAGEAKFAKDPKGTYPDRGAAVRAFMDAIRAGLPKPSVIVSSGEGLHVYWALDADVAPAEWKPTALMLNAAGKALGLKIDSVCTADEARVLRPVGAVHKNGNRVEVLRTTGLVYTHSNLTASLKALLPEEAAFELATAPRRAPARSLNDDILTFKSAPASLARVADYCGAVAEMRDSEGNVPEPLWRAVMGVAKYCEVDGERLVHEWSTGHPGYDARATQAKFERWDTPPTTCSYFSGISEHCAGCKFNGKITTPKQLGATTNESIAADKPILGNPTADSLPQSEPDGDASTFSGMSLPDDDETTVEVHGTALAVADASAACPVPERADLFDQTQPFFYKKSKGNWTLFHTFKAQTTDPTGQKVFNEVTKAVCHKLVWVDASSDVGASEADGVLVQLGRVARADSAHQDRFDMPAGMVSEVGTLSKFMLDQGINFEPTNNDAGKHLKSFILREMIRKQNDMRFVIKNRFGYHMHEDQFVCCLGAHTVYPDGSIMRTVHNSKLKSIANSLTPGCLPPRVQPIWSGDDWIGIEAHAAAYSAFIRKHYNGPGYDKARLALAISLASPFLSFAADAPFTDADALPPMGFVISLYSTTSGVGKTALEDVICAAYGKTSLRKSGDSDLMTKVAGFTTAQNLAIFPLVLDEVTQNNAATAAKMVNAFANGTGRERAEQTGALQEAPKTWSLVTCMSTNVPQRELVAVVQKNSDALQLRMLELDFSDMPLTGNKDLFREEFHEIALNCGAYGLVQARLATYLGPVRLNRLVKNNLTKAFEVLGVDQTYRFFARALAIALTNIQIMGKLSPFEAEDVIATFKNALGLTQGFVKDHKRTPQDTLAQLLSAASPNVAVTRSFTKRAGRGSEDRGDVLLNPNVHTPLFGREVKEWGQVILTRSFVNKWCSENQVPSSSLLAELTKAGLLMVMEDGSIARQVKLGTGIASQVTNGQWCFTFRTSTPTESAEADPANVVPLRTETAPVDAVRQEAASV